MIYPQARVFVIVQHPTTGLIYVGNERGVLEYDGARWRLLPLPAGYPSTGLVVRGLDVDEQGRLWAGADNDVVVYAPDERGRWRGESVVSRLPESERALGVVWNLRAQGGLVWGAATNRIVCFDLRMPGAVSWRAANPAIIGVVVGEVWFRQNSNELYRVRRGQLELAAVSDEL